MDDAAPDPVGASGSGAPAAPAVVEAVLGDITTQRLDAIVNAANGSLLGGGGVDGAIHAAAGPALLQECRQVRRERWPDGLPVGLAQVTGAGALPSRWVVHTVGPNRHRGETDPQSLASCFTESLAAAAEVGARSVAFPAVSAGIYGWDADDVARIAIDSVRRVLAAGWSRHRSEPDLPDFTPGRWVSLQDIELVRFVLFSGRLLDAFDQALRRE
jgi:O-acetyl-ADP-ribose deacetylase (regulator of RNase III)